MQFLVRFKRCHYPRLWAKFFEIRFSYTRKKVHTVGTLTFYTLHKGQIFKLLVVNKKEWRKLDTIRNNLLRAQYGFEYRREIVLGFKEVEKSSKIFRQVVHILPTSSFAGILNVILCRRSFSSLFLSLFDLIYAALPRISYTIRVSSYFPYLSPTKLNFLFYALPLLLFGFIATLLFLFFFQTSCRE